MRRGLVLGALVIACGGSSVDRNETVATLPTPPTATTTVVATSTLRRTDDGWPCARPPIVTEHQEKTLEQMTLSGRADLVQQAAELRARICAHWAHRGP